MKKQKGFTLVELVIVIAIVIVLSVVSVPIYNNYVEKAMYTEGYALLGTILSAQKAYYSEYGNFLGYSNETFNTPSNPILGIDARGNKYFTAFTAASSNNNGEKRINYYFMSRIFLPEKLKIDGEKTELVLQYNITLGGKFSEHPKPGTYTSWY